MSQFQDRISPYSSTHYIFMFSSYDDIIWQTQVINPSIHLCYVYRPSLLFSAVASFLSAWGY
jgi:hypothetical protein